MTRCTCGRGIMFCLCPGVVPKSWHEGARRVAQTQRDDEDLTDILSAVVMSLPSYTECPEHGEKLVRGRCRACDCPFTEDE